ncbi:DegV family protein [Syntrophomonas palmitatica]|uniref:DegV family protein n=1 Tax=Syntrophomonas palmitatica TaxID=402877 RepID=UPI0006D20C4B|nr:DegV family protein [Syntrophomonas palmitatica]
MNEKIALLIDSMSDLPRDVINHFNIKMLPAWVIYPDKQYRDRVDIEPEDVYRRMPGEVPTTSLPLLEDIRSMFDKIRQEGFTHVLALHISSALSSTVQAVDMIAKEIKDMKVHVVDTRTLSMGTGWIVLEAARNISNGMSFENVKEKVHQLQSKVQVYYVIETLEYLRRGGRIGKVASMLGELMDIKPIISVDEQGKYFTFCKARGRRKSIEKLVEIVENAVKEKQINLAVMHGGAARECEKLLERFNKLPNIKEIISSDISPALGVHTGPGLLGVSFYQV